MTWSKTCRVLYDKFGKSSACVSSDWSDMIVTTSKTYVALYFGIFFEDSRLLIASNSLRLFSWKFHSCPCRYSPLYKRCVFLRIEATPVCNKGKTNCLDRTGFCIQFFILCTPPKPFRWGTKLSLYLGHNRLTWVGISDFSIGFFNSFTYWKLIGIASMIFFFEWSSSRPRPKLWLSSLYPFWT